MLKSKFSVLLFFYSVFLWAFAIFSYSLTDPNLVLSTNPQYWNLQTYMWQTFFENRQLLSYIYFFLTTILIITYLVILKIMPNLKNRVKWLVIYSLLAVLPLSISYNALSHDVFNYIFNARMVIKYGADPHVQTAIQFADIDDWVRFMHNTHTPAPYGYGWTAISLLPVFIGSGKFLATWLLMRAVAILSILLLIYSLDQLSLQIRGEKVSVRSLAWLLLNPLFLIEVVSSMHNDLWMMGTAILGLAWLMKGLSLKDSKRWLWIFASAVVLILSVQIKFASLALLPVILLVLSSQRQLEKLLARFSAKMKVIAKPVELISSTILKRIYAFVPIISSILMFLPLLTQRSQQFLPWYLIWPMVWVPLIKSKWWRNVLLAFTITALWRYLPWLYQGNYDNNVIFNQKLITWGLAILLILILKKHYFRNQEFSFKVIK